MRLFLVATFFASLHAQSAETDHTRLGAFIDGVVEEAVVDREIVGAAVAVVQNGRAVVLRGYGYANLGKGVEVDPRTSGFRIGSITKTLNAMAVLQQVEAGRLDLDADIRDYLKRVPVPDEYTDTITLRHLLTHTAGFEQLNSNLFVSGPRRLGTLTQVLVDAIPSRVRLPGSVVAYSNYGAGLAGQIVADVTDLDWHDYMDSYLLKPLGMEYASTRQPLPDRLDSSRAAGYDQNPYGGFTELPFDFLPLAPAGSVTASALDMARLMAELLDRRDTAVLTRRSKEQMLSGAYVSHPRVNGVTLGMFQMTRGSTPAVGHDGSVLDFHSRMILWPRENLGLFVSVNSSNGFAVPGRLSDAVARHLGLDEKEVNSTATGNIAPYIGDYMGARRSHSDFTSVFGLADTVRVRDAGEDSTLSIQTRDNIALFRRIDEDVFQEVGGYRRAVFVMESVRPRVLYFSDLPMLGYTPVDTTSSLVLNQAVLAVWALLALTVVLYWPVTGWLRRGTRAARGGFGPAVLTGASILVVSAFAVQVAPQLTQVMTLYRTGFRGIAALLWLPVGFFALVVLQAGYMYRVWLGPLWWPVRRIHYTLFLAANIALAWWFWHWNLLPEPVLTYLK